MARVCNQLGDFREALKAYAGGFVAVALAPGEPERALADAAAIESMASTLKALLAAFLADTGHWRGSGHRSEADALARETGTSTGAAKDAIDTGRRLEDQPDLSGAARAGELSAAQTSMIANATAANPGAGRRLIHKARTSSLPELREECARTKAGADPDPEGRHARIHAGRDLRSYADLEGIWHLHAKGTPEAGAQIMAALAPLADGAFEAARREGRREAPGAYGFDALVELATTATSDEDAPGAATGPAATGAPGPARRKGAPVKLNLRVDWTALLRGVAAEGEVCELVGYGPVPVSVIKALISYGDPFVTAVITRGTTLAGVAHLGRKPTALQQTALEWLYPACAVEGCPHQAHLETDHRIDWAKIHLTVFDWLDRLCRFHHRLKTLEGWALVEGIGKRAFVPPDDPRHPQYKRRSEAA
jgi:hypothetical protein